MSDKIVILNGKRFIVGNSKIKSTKCNIGTKRKKLLNKEEQKMFNKKNKKNDKIYNNIYRRKTNRTSRKCRDIKDIKEKI